MKNKKKTYIASFPDLEYPFCHGEKKNKATESETPKLPSDGIRRIAV